MTEIRNYINYYSGHLRAGHPAPLQPPAARPLVLHAAPAARGPGRQRRHPGPGEGRQQPDILQRGLRASHRRDRGLQEAARGVGPATGLW